MTAIYGVCVVAGIASLISWATLAGLRLPVADKSRSWVTATSGVLAFGLAGLSAEFAGWPVGAHVGAAVLAAVAAVAYARRVGIPSR